MDDDKTKLKLHKEQRKKASRDRRTRDQDFKESDIDHRLEKRKSAPKVEDFGVHSGLAPYDDKDALKSDFNILLYHFTSSLNVSF